MHLTTSHFNQNLHFNEPSFVSPGQIQTTSLSNIVDSPIGKLGLSICYDLRFPYVFYQPAYKGAEILLNASQFPQISGLAHWEILLRARAIENTCYVAGTNLTGELFPNSIQFGHSMVIGLTFFCQQHISDPYGKVLLDMKEEVGIGFANIDLEYLREVRKQIPCLKHKKNYLANL